MRTRTRTKTIHLTQNGNPVVDTKKTKVKLAIYRNTLSGDLILQWPNTAYIYGDPDEIILVSFVHPILMMGDTDEIWRDFIRAAEKVLL